MELSKTVDEYIIKNQHWQEELIFLRKLLCSTEMVETLKWGIPSYTIDGKNVVGLVAFKEFFGIWFYQGVFLSDQGNKLINAQEGKTKAMRQWRFLSFEEIEEQLLMKYLHEAIANQKAGKEIKREKKPLVVPDELQRELEGEANLMSHFESLSLTRKREFADYVSQAKRTETKLSRVSKIKPMIIAGIGLNDKYRS